MAKLSSDGKYVIVEKGDTLWAIAAKYEGGGKNYTKLASHNKLKNPNRIYVGQKIYLTKAAVPSSSTGNTTNKASNVVEVDGPHLLSTSDNELYVTWKWSKRNKTINGKNTLMTDKYKIVWEYQTVQGIWFTGESGEKTVDEDYYEASEEDTYSIPTGAVKVQFKIKPISKTYNVTTEFDKFKDTGVKLIDNSLNAFNEKETKTVAYFDNIAWSPWATYTVTQIFETLSAPTVDIDEDNKLTASYENLTIDATYMEFEIFKDDEVRFGETRSATINKDQKRVSYSCTVDPGHEYKVRCRASKKHNSVTLTSDWSPFSANVQSMPAVPGKVKCKANGKDQDKYSVYIEWSKITSADTYTIEYTTKKEYFDNAGGSVSRATTEDESTSIVIFGLDASEYFFRVQATNGKGSSDWSEIASVKIGEPPAAPTTWSSTTTAIVGEPLTLYWSHNSEDGSSQTYGRLELDIDNRITTYEIKNDGYYGINASGALYKIKDYEKESEKELTRYCLIDTSIYTEGTVIKWRACTSGITNTFGDWSVQREIDVYAKPSIDLLVTDEFNVLEDGTIELKTPEGGVMDVLEQFPFYLRAIAGPSTQTPVSYHLTVTSNETYETVDALGNVKMVNAGTQVYSNYFDITTALLVEFPAANIDLENNIEYMITCTVSMDSGLTAEQTSTFRVSWVETQYHPDADIALNLDTFSTTIRPYCEERMDVTYSVKNESGKYIVDTKLTEDDAFDDVYTTTGERVLVGKNTSGSIIYYCIAYMDSEGKPYSTPVYYRVTNSNGQYVTSSTKLNRSSIKNFVTETGEVISLGTTETYDEGYYCTVEERVLVEGITLAVYRREFDGGFTKIADGINNTSITSVTDPHPSLDYARYRIVATANSTGAVSYNDLPPFPIGCVSAIIQWDEAWSDYEGSNEDTRSEPTWGGSILYLPYNIDVSDSNDVDVSHVNYVGRKHPVSYYGTQVGQTSTWNMDVEKEDIDTIYALRRLSQWMGDVYVREPSGSGYWANVKVSFSQKHKALTVPVTLSLTRVEGGI